MRTSSTTRKYSVVFCFLLFSLNVLQLQAQSNRCGFISKITNSAVINLCSGSSVTLNGSPTGGAYSYKWQRQTTAGGPFADIAGASSANYSTNTLGAYRVLISNGTCTDTSGITNLVRINLSGGTISGGTSSPICPITDVGFLKGDVVPGYDIGVVTYEWETNVNNAGWTSTGIPGIDFKVGFLTKNTVFRRVAMDNCGNKAYSNIISLQVTPEISGGAIAPLRQTINLGASAAPINSATPATGGSGNLTYQWASSLYERGPFADIAGATAASYSPGALQQTTYFIRKAVDANCNPVPGLAEKMAVVFVNGAPLNPGYFTSAASCFFPGQAPTRLESVPPTGGTAPYTIEWQWSTDDNSWTTIPGATGERYQPPILTQTTYFRTKVTDAAGTVAYSRSERIYKVESTLTGGTIAATSSVACLGSPPAMIKSTGSATGSGEDLIYQWQYRTAGSSVWIDIPGAIRENVTPEPIDQKTIFRRVAVDRCGPNKRTAFSNEIEIDIRPALFAGAINPTWQMVGKNGTPKQLQSIEAPSGGTGSYTLSWETGTLAVGPWTLVNGADGASYQPTALNQTTYFRRVAKDNNCLATKYTYVVEVTVNDAPELIGGRLGGSTCVFPGNRPGIIGTNHVKLVSGGVPPYTFQWEKRAGFTGPFTPIPGATFEQYRPEIISETHQFRRMVMDAFGTTAYSDTITIEYHTAALQPGMIGATSPTLICNGAIPDTIVSMVSMSGYGENARYQWQIRLEGGDWTDIAGQVRENYVPTAVITQRTYFRRWAFDICAGVTRSVVSNEVMFDIAPPVTLKTGLVDGPFITCAGTAPGMIKSVLEACGSGANKYQWEMNSGSGWSTIGGATGASYTPGVINNNTTFRRKVTDACGNTGYSNEVLIYVYPPIEPGIIGTATQSVCPNTTPAAISLLTSCHYTDGTVTYQWQSSSNPGGPWSNISGANGSSYQPAASTTNMYYRLEVRSTTCNFVAHTNVASVLMKAGCRVASPIVGGIPAPVGSGVEKIKVYPNPVNGTSVNVAVETKGKVSVRMQAADGQIVPVTISRSSSSLLTLQLPDRLANGAYLIQIFDEKKRWTQKIIVP